MDTRRSLVNSLMHQMYRSRTPMSANFAKNVSPAIGMIFQALSAISSEAKLQ